MMHAAGPVAAGDVADGVARRDRRRFPPAARDAGCDRGKGEALKGKDTRVPDDAPPGLDAPARKAPRAKTSDGEHPDHLPMPLWERPGFLVRRLHQIHSAIFLEECKAFGITPVQYGLMTTLLQHSGSDQRTLGVEVGIDRTNVADVLERLAERGLVRRERSDRDRRSMNAYLTEEGRELVEKMYASMVKAQQRLLEPLDPEFRPAFLAMLSQLVEGNNQYSRAELKADFKTRRRTRRGEE